MVPSKDRFRNSLGVRYLLQLFFEKTDSDKSNVLYTLKDRDHNGYPSLYRLYLEEDDITEYRFANKYMEGWEHWTMLTKSTWFKPFIARWREELSLKQESEILSTFKRIAESGEEGSFQANKIRLDRIRKPKEASKRGRPSSQDLDIELKRLADESASTRQDAERILS